MSLTIEIPRLLEEELTQEAQREGVSATEHATLLLYLGTALLKESNPVPFQDTVKSFLAHRSPEDRHIASDFRDFLVQHTGSARSIAPRGQERDPELVARVRRNRGKFAHLGNGRLASEDLHAERRADDARDELQFPRYKP